ncbi:MAG: hypothetical protein HY291_12940 [Planctomycetes bacterium]|nr:hypothetical protein [Planctomycetota bacterium]
MITLCWLGVRLIVVTLVLFLLAGALLAGENGAALPPAAPPAGLRVFTAGHSFHVWVADILSDIAKGAGIKGHKVAGISSIGGSRVMQHWDVPDDQNKAKHALTAGAVDVLTLSPIWLPDEGIEKFAKLAVEHNPNVRITVQEFWLPNDEYVPVYPLQTSKKVDHDAATVEQLRKHYEKYRKDMDDMVRKQNEQLGKQVCFVVPSGEAAILLREKIIAGQAPGLRKQSELFHDSWGHPGEALMVLAGYCHFAVLYRRCPVGLPMPEILAKSKTLNDEKLNRLLQELAWDAVYRHPLSGVQADPQSPRPSATRKTE